MATVPPLPSPKLWLPKRLLVTRSALAWDHGRAIAARATDLGVDVRELPTDRLQLDLSDDPRRAYAQAKQTMALTVASPSKRRPQPIAPSADWRVDLAEGCPAHCQYCYLAGSLAGPPVVRVFANLPQLLDNTARYEQAGRLTSFEVSCYTDVLGIEHLTGSLAECIRHYGQREGARLRFVSKYDHVDSLLSLPHHGHTRARFSLNAEPVVRRLEAGTASVEARLRALRRG